MSDKAKKYRKEAKRFKKKYLKQRDRWDDLQDYVTELFVMNDAMAHCTEFDTEKAKTQAFAYGTVLEYMENDNEQA
jgi:hypothetical protein